MTPPDDSERGLSRCFAQLSAQAAAIRQEATLRQRFVQCLDHTLESMGLHNKRVRAILEERIVRGRSDARIGGIVFEVKLPPPRGQGLEAAIEQARDYIGQHQQRGEQVRGVAYDGEQIAFLTSEGRELRRDDAQHGATTLEAWLMLLGGAVVEPQDMVRRFGLASPVMQDSVSTLLEVFDTFREQVGFIDEAYNVWQGLYGCAANLNPQAIRGLRDTANRVDNRLHLRGQAEAEKFLFALETYLTIFLKLLIARVAVQQRLVPDPTVTSLVTSAHQSACEKFAGLQDTLPHLTNVFEQDIFLWFRDAAVMDIEAEARLSDILRQIAASIDDVDIVGVREDFLRLFYQGFFEPAARRALGEFYTSPQLCEETLDAAGYEGNISQKLADICCGSGSFLVAAINRAIEYNQSVAPSSLVQAITENIIGVDIHPLAVAMARANYIIALSDLLTPETWRSIESLPIPVYWADSLARLRRPEQAELDETRMTVDVYIPNLGGFTLPHPEQLDWHDLFHAVHRLVDRSRGILEADQILPRLLEELPAEVGRRFEPTLRNFLEEIVERERSNRDMRWLPLLENGLKLEELAGQCDYIVGNPPWVRIHNIERGLRARLNDNYRFYHDAGWSLGCQIAGISRGFARQVDYCVPFVERSVELLRPGGTLALVITSKIQQTLYANVLRSELVNQTSIRRISDYSLYAVPLFQDATNYPLIFAVDKASPDADHRVEVVIHNSHGDVRDFETTQSELPLVSGDTGSPWLAVPPEVRGIFHTMAGGTRYLGSSEATRPRRGIVTAYNAIFVVTQVEETDTPGELVVTTEAGEHIRIERQLLRPIIRGADVNAWQAAVSEYIIWTHDDESAEVLETLPPQATKYFEREDITSPLTARSDYRKGIPIWTVFRTAPEKLTHKVVWQELSNQMDAAYMPPYLHDEILGRALVIPLQTTYLIPVPGPRQGYALSGLLNSLPVGAYLCSFAARARGSYFRYIAWTVGLVPLPNDWLDAFTPHIRPRTEGVPESMQRIAEISEQLHQQPGPQSQERLEASLDEEVAALYGLTSADLDILTSFFAFLKGTTLPIGSQRQESE